MSGGGNQTSREQRQLFNIMGELGQESSAREGYAFTTAQQDAIRARERLGYLTSSAAEAQALNDQLAGQARARGGGLDQRAAAQEIAAQQAAGGLAGLAQGYQPLGTQILNQSALGQMRLGSQAVNPDAQIRLNQLGSQATNARNLNELSGYSGDLRGLAGEFDPTGMSVADLRGVGGAAMGEAARSAASLNPQIGMQALIGQAGLRQVGQLGQELGGIRGAGLSQLEQVMRGEVPGELQQLLRGSAGTSERDVMEAQFANLERQARESGGQRGLGLSRNLTNVQAQRALSLAEAEARRDTAERQAALGLYNTALGQGLSAPAQQQQALGLALGAYGQAGQQQLGAEGLRQGALGLAGQAYGAAGQQRLGELQGAVGAQQAAAGVAAQNEALRQAQLGLSGQLTTQADQQRLAQLGLAGQLYGQAGQADLQRVQANMQQRALQGQLMQANIAAQAGLAGQFGQRADRLQYGVAPGLEQQNVAYNQLLAQSQGLPSSILRGGGVGTTPASAYFNQAAGLVPPPGTPGYTGNAAIGAGVGGVAGGLIGAYYGGPVGAGAGYSIGSGAGGAIGGLFG